MVERRSSEKSISRRVAVGLVVGTGLTALAACATPTAPTPAAKPTAGNAQPSPAAKAASGGAPTPAAKPIAPTKHYADSIVMARPSMTSALDPHGNSVNANFAVPHQIYDTLVAFDASGQRLIPQLASEWKRVDTTTLELKLRDDVRFSNGEAFTAATVKYNVERLMESKEASMVNLRNRMGALVAAEPMNSTTVRLKTKDPDPLILNRLTMFFMGPEKYLQSGADVNTQPIGTGSFKVASYKPGAELRLEAWDGSWRPKSTVRSVRMVGLPEIAGLAASLRSGEADIAAELQGDLMANLKRDFKTASMNAGSCTVMSMAPTPPFDDKRVRLAMNHAINREEIVQTIYGGYGRVAQGQLLQPGMPGYDDSLKAIPYDPEKAASLLREAGVGQFEADFTIANTPAHKSIGEAIAGYLKVVGVTINFQQLEAAVFLRKMTTKFDTPFFIWDTYYWYLQDFDAAAQMFALHPQQPRFPNEPFKQLYLQTRTELDPEKRAGLIKQAARLMYDEVPGVFLVWGELPLAYNKKIEDLTIWQDRSIPLWTVRKEA